MQNILMVTVELSIDNTASDCTKVFGPLRKLTSDEFQAHIPGARLGVSFPVPLFSLGVYLCYPAIKH